jgi:dihydroflavonol-4-reductase
VNSCVVFGAGDYNLSSTRIVRSFLLGRVPMYVEGAFSMVDVRDAARGFLLADELGGVGERYILGGRNFTFDRLFADLARLSGIDPPVKLPAALALAAASALGDRAPVAPDEVRAAGHWWTYRATKARRELGWRARPHEETLEATVAWHLEREHGRIARSRGSQQIQYRLAGAALRAGEGALGVASQLLRRRSWLP